MKFHTTLHVQSNQYNFATPTQRTHEKEKAQIYMCSLFNQNRICAHFKENHNWANGLTSWDKLEPSARGTHTRWGLWASRAAEAAAGHSRQWPTTAGGAANSGTRGGLPHREGSPTEADVPETPGWSTCPMKRLTVSSAASGLFFLGSHSQTRYLPSVCEGGEMITDFNSQFLGTIRPPGSTICSIITLFNMSFQTKKPVFGGAQSSFPLKINLSNGVTSNTRKYFSGLDFHKDTVQ